MDKGIREYLSPVTIEEALSIYSGYNFGDICWLAGGTDLKLPLNKSYKAAVDIKKIKALMGMGFVNNERYFIGALTTIQEIEDNPELPKDYAILVEAARQFGSRQVRERGTVGGNICNGSPSADIATALLSLDAELCWQGPEGEVREKLTDYYRQEREARRNKKGCLLQRIELPASPKPLIGAYLKLGERNALEVGLVSAAVVIKLENGKMKDARISLGGAAPSPIRCSRTESLLRCSDKYNSTLFSEAGDMAAMECMPISDAFASAEYRKAMIRTFVKRGLEIVLGRGDGR